VRVDQVRIKKRRTVYVHDQHTRGGAREAWFPRVQPQRVACDRHGAHRWQCRRRRRSGAHVHLPDVHTAPHRPHGRIGGQCGQRRRPRHLLAVHRPPSYVGQCLVGFLLGKVRGRRWVWGPQYCRPLHLQRRRGAARDGKRGYPCGRTTAPPRVGRHAARETRPKKSHVPALRPPLVRAAAAPRRGQRVGRVRQDVKQQLDLLHDRRGARRGRPHPVVRRL